MEKELEWKAQERSEREEGERKGVVMGEYGIGTAKLQHHMETKFSRNSIKYTCM